MSGTESYQAQFEKLQRIKNELFDTNQSHEYKEDKEYFYAKSFKLKKRQYVERAVRLNTIKTALRELYAEYLSVRGLYLGSRSSGYDELMRRNFESIDRLHREMAQLRLQHAEHPNRVFDHAHRDADTEDHGPDTEKAPASPTPTPRPDSPTEKTASKEKRVKRFLFKTYNECISKKRSEPTYMSKEEIIAHIKKHDPGLIKHLPKRLEAMKKEEICKVILYK